MKKSRLLVLLCCLLAVHLVTVTVADAAAWEGTDDFSSGISMANWTLYQKNSGQMTVEGTNGHASFLVPSSTTESQSAHIIWHGTPTAAEDWTVEITGYAFAGYSVNGDSALQLGVGHGSDGYRIAMNVEKDWGGAQEFNVKQSLNGKTVSTPRASAPRISGISAMRLVYHSGSKLIEAWYDPGASGLGWTKLDTISLADFSPSMTESDTFSFAILGNTYYGPISEGEIWADNFRITSSASVCASTLASDLSLHVPILDFAGYHYWVDFMYVPDLDFTIVNFGEVSDLGPYNACAHATLSGTTLGIHIPDLIFESTSYWADFAYKEGLTVTLVNSGAN